MPETPLPDHAVAEIKAAKGERKAELRRWWDSWATVGDVKAARQAALEAVFAAEQALVEADDRRAALEQLKAAEAALAEADAAVQKDIARHKAVK